ncbi:DHHW family protein [Dysosmobacter sp. HCP28S3_G4]|uniref:DHHW family protein n=1 Tax=Dysosmobacter sp. HCP28S3_G4 TaxID=3438938 RepID=UPI003F8BC758
MTKAYSRLVAAVFCLFLGGMLVWSLLLPDRDRSEAENRTLAQWPAFSWASLRDGSYTEAVEEYFSDQFPLRDQWTGLKARAEQIIGKREFHGVYLCDDPLFNSGTLISRVDTPDAALVEKNLGYVTALTDKTDVPAYLGLIPSAAEIWQDRLPAGAESWDQAAFLKRAAETGVPVVDFRSILSAHADEYIFYRTDHHWTSRGAYYGYAAVMEALGRGAETLPITHFAPEPVSGDFNGTLYSQSGVHWLEPDYMQFWVPEEGLTVTSWRSGAPETAALYDRTYLDQKDKYSAFLGGNQPLCVIQNEALPDGGKLLLVRDSYSDSLAPFLSQSFSEIHLLDLRYYRASVAQYAAENDIDAILVLYSVPNFVTDRNLAFLGQ